MRGCNDRGASFLIIGGSDLAPPTRAQPDGTVVKALARAWRWQRQLDAAVYVSLADIAAAEKLSPSYVCRIARVAMLAPDIVEAILAGTLNQNMMLDQLEKGGRVEGAEKIPPLMAQSAPC